MKRTLRRFTLAVPDGTELQQIRTFVRAVDGTEYPVDREIEVPLFTTAVREFDLSLPGSIKMEDCNEAHVLALMPPGSRVLETRDFVTAE